MGSLPDLTERARPLDPRPAARTISDPHRHRAVLTQIPVSTIYRKEWPWRKPRVPARAPVFGAINRRRDSAASSVGAASVRRLITRQPPKVPKAVVRRFTILCIASGLCATALLPFTAFAGAEAGAVPLAIMHTAAAVVAPFSPSILQKTGPRLIVTVAHVLVCVLLSAHTVAMPLTVLLFLYAICGVTLSPMSLALTVSATSLAQAAGDECRRKIALRRALRGLRASQDLGLVLGSLLLGGALMIWPEDLTPLQATAATANVTVPGWPPPEEFYIEDDYEERTCGAAGCPQIRMLSGGAGLSGSGRSALTAAWAGLALAGAALAAAGASAAAAPPDSRASKRDPRATLAAPMGLFIGLQQGFIYTSYIKWYGVCVGGWVGAWRALCGAGALQALAAATLSMAAARAGGAGGGGVAGRAFAAGGGAAHASLLLALLRWRAARSDLALPAVAAAAWGACAALWDVLQWYGVCVGGWVGAWRALCGAGALQALAVATLSMAAARAGGAGGGGVAGRAFAAGGGAAHASLLLALLRWRAARSDLALPAVAAAAWGACAALWDVLQSGICVGGPGWRGPWSLTLASRHAGLALACVARRLLCVRAQLAGLALSLAAALASHIALEVRQRRAEARRS